MNGEYGGGRWWMGQQVSMQHKARAQHRGCLTEGTCFCLQLSLTPPSACLPAPDSDDHRVGDARLPAQAEGSGCCEQEGAAEHL